MSYSSSVPLQDASSAAGLVSQYLSITVVQFVAWHVDRRFATLTGHIQGEGFYSDLGANQVTVQAEPTGS